MTTGFAVGSIYSVEQAFSCSLEIVWRLSAELCGQHLVELAVVWHVEQLADAIDPAVLFAERDEPGLVWLDSLRLAGYAELDLAGPFLQRRVAISVARLCEPDPVERDGHDPDSRDCRRLVWRGALDPVEPFVQRRVAIFVERLCELGLAEHDGLGPDSRGCRRLVWLCELDLAEPCVWRHAAIAVVRFYEPDPAEHV